MNSVSRFIFLMSLIANCHFAPLTEFDIDFHEIEKVEKSYQVSHALAVFKIYIEKLLIILIITILLLITN